MKKLICTILVFLVLMPTAFAGDMLTLLSVYRSDWTDQAEAVVVTMNRFPDRYDLTDAAFDPADPLSVIQAITHGDVKPSGKPTLKISNEVYEVINRYKAKRGLLVGGPAAVDAGGLYRYAIAADAVSEDDWVALSVSGDLAMQNFDWGAVKLDWALCQLMPANDYFGEELTPQASWPTEFSYNYGSYSGGAYEYSLKLNDGKLRFKARGYNGVDLSIDRDIDPDVMAHASEAILVNELDNWDGYKERDPDILDGYDFALRYVKKGKEYKASGYEHYPENYPEAHQHLLKFFDRLVDVYG